MMPVEMMILAMGLMWTVGMNSNKDSILILTIVASTIVMMLATTQFQVYKNAAAMIVAVIEKVSATTTMRVITIQRPNINWFPIVSTCAP